MSQIATLPKRSLVDSMAAKYEMEPQAFMGAVKATCIKGDCSNEQFAAFLMVAKEYDLNPLTKEIYAFPDRGGITPIVSIDGWMNLINSHPEFDGMEFTDSMDDAGKLFSVECRMYRKDRQRPTSVIEYMSECARATDPWKKWPNRMLRHKAAIQCARYAFGFSGIMEPDEYERMRDVTPAAKPTVMERLRNQQEPTGDREGFDPSFVQSETDATLQGDVIDAETNSNTDDVTPPASSVDAGAAASASEAVDETPTPSTASTDHHAWLLNIARLLWAATSPNGDVEVFNTQRKVANNMYPIAADCPEQIQRKAKFVSAYCMQVINNEIEQGDGLAMVAGVVGVDQDDILKQGEAL